MFNPQYVNQAYYRQLQNQLAQYDLQQNIKVAKVVNAFHDLLEATEGLDKQHQKVAVLACLAELDNKNLWKRL